MTVVYHLHIIFNFLYIQLLSFERGVPSEDSPFDAQYNISVSATFNFEKLEDTEILNADIIGFSQAS